MGLFTVSISDEDRVRVDQLISVLTRMTALLETVVNQKELIARVDLVNKPTTQQSAK